MKRIKVGDIISLIVIVYFIYYFISSVLERKEFMNNESQIKYTVGKIKKLKLGAKVSPWFIYEFHIDSILHEGTLSLTNVNDNEKHVNRYYLIKYNVVKPKYNELFLNMKISDSLFKSKNHTWNEIPKGVEYIPSWRLTK